MKLIIVITVIALIQLPIATAFTELPSSQLLFYSTKSSQKKKNIQDQVSFLSPKSSSSSVAAKGTTTFLNMSASSQISNKLKQFARLSNQFYALRHGQSKANIAKIISSDPSISTIEHGLTDVGKNQVQTTATLFSQEYNMNTKNENQQKHPVAIFSSDFTRARETASIFAEVLNENDIPLLFNYNDEDGDGADVFGVKYDKRLRERYFGEFNGKSDSHYQDVWDVDCVDANHTKYDVESVNSVVERTSSLILDIEKTLKTKNKSESEPGAKVILVAHGDVLQILQTAFLKVDGSIHRSLDHLDTAGVREFALNPKEVE